VKHSSKESNLLVTHFHEDHVSGLIHMMHDKSYAGLFNTLFIPDVFSSNQYERVLALLILEDILKKWKLGEKKCTLYDFVKFFCTKIERVVLLKRGDKFKEYIKKN
jgi:ribonuclease BN (tRNA processing enzyme)